ncbi:MAG: hypothetical protein BRD23_07940 [Halobacteriales archaeon SW_9_67_25]|jgi:hypothetical protein|nr:MAG: hypothetical protein BRD23_07940 [Halobacteriales archaeon SW_9_67_25]
MEYSTRLPAAHLGGEALPALEETLLSDCTSPRLEVELDHGPVTYTYSSLAEIREDATLPGVVKSFEVSLSAHEGEADLVADDRDNELRLRLTGDREWVESKRRAIEGFFRSHGATVRTFLERYMAFCLGFVATGLGLALYYSGVGADLGMGSPVDSLLFGSLALIGGGVLHLLLNVVYPYAALVTSARANSWLVYLRR